MTGILIALSAFGLAAVLLRTRRAPTGRRAAGRRQGRPRVRAEQPQRLARPVALIAAAALAAVAHPAVGVLCGAAMWWLLPAVVARLDTTEDVRRRAELSVQLPVAAGLLSACLSSGASLAASLGVVGESLADPAHSLLVAAARTAELGGGPDELARVLAAAGEPGWVAMGAAVLRSSTTGAPLAELLHDQADQAMHTWFAAASVRARAVAVRCVLPLALCFLPAFLLLGVAPLVAGLLGGLDLP